MDRLISICIPTYQRPQLLEAALTSCLEQSYAPLEIIIGDDSIDDNTEYLIEEFQSKSQIKIRYIHNKPALGQSANVNMLFDAANGYRLILLHDDDLLLPTAVEDLDRCWSDVPNLTAAYGKQYIISMDGSVLIDESENANLYYQRISKLKGLQSSSLKASLNQQFPNDGFLILSSVARIVKCRSKELVGDACDFDFSLRLGTRNERFYFLDKYTLKYRLTGSSISNNSDYDGYLQKYKLIHALDLSNDLDLDRERKYILSSMTPQLVSEYIKQSNRRLAIYHYFSVHYPLRKRLSFKSLLQLISILLPSRIVAYLSLIQLKNYVKIKMFNR
jgi:glycosyltransferase involved in cell wall biosynthesis